MWREIDMVTFSSSTLLTTSMELKNDQEKVATPKIWNRKKSYILRKQSKYIVLFSNTCHSVRWWYCTCIINFYVKMSVRIGGSEGETSVCFVAGPSLYFVKWGGSAVCQDNITTAHLQQLRISGVSAAMDQCRSAGGAQDPAQLARTVPTKQAAEGTHHSPSIISVIPEQILQFPEIGRAAWHCHLGRGSSGPDSGGKLQTALCWPQFRLTQEADYHNNHLVLSSFCELASRLWLGYGWVWV